MFPDNTYLIFRLKASLAFTLICIIGYLIYDLSKG